ncbi:MAG: FecR domain-containing protein, partial [Candidatus Thermochlorobacter sp.]
MRKRTLKTIILGLIAFCVAGASTASEKPKAEGEGVALVIKAVKIVEAREKQEAWRGVQRGQQLNSGTQVRTGEQSFSILKFADNSVVRVAESSQIVVRGDKDKTNAMNKTIELNLGKVGFNIKKQGANEQFRFVSPTSVASIKGTSGYFSPNSLLILEG